MGILPAYLIIGLVILVSMAALWLVSLALKESKPGYKECVASTSEFIPWFPKSYTGGSK